MSDYLEAIDRAEARRKAKEERSIARVEAKREDPTEATIFIEETAPRKIKIKIPCYRKDSTWVVKILSEREYIQVLQPSSIGVYYTHRFNSNSGDFFDAKWEESTEQEFVSAWVVVREQIEKDWVNI